MPYGASSMGGSVKRLAVLAAFALLFSLAAVPTVDAEAGGRTLITSKAGSRVQALNALLRRGRLPPTRGQLRRKGLALARLGSIQGPGRWKAARLPEHGTV